MMTTIPTLGVDYERRCLCVGVQDLKIALANTPSVHCLYCTVLYTTRERVCVCVMTFGGNNHKLLRGFI